MTSVSSNMPALLEVGQQRGDRAGRSRAASLRMVGLDVVVVVPRLTGAVPELHKAHAPFEQPPRDQRLPAMHAVAVEVADVLPARG